MNEILQGIRMLKWASICLYTHRVDGFRFMAWERSYENRIKAIRSNELSWQAKNYQLELVLTCVGALTPVLVTVVSFLVSATGSGSDDN